VKGDVISHLSTCNGKKIIVNPCRDRWKTDGFYFDQQVNAIHKMSIVSKERVTGKEGEEGERIKEGRKVGR